MYSVNIISIVLDDLLGCLLGFSSFKFSNPGRGFLAQQTATPVTTDLIKAFVVVVLDCFNQLGQVSLVVGFHLKKI